MRGVPFNDGDKDDDDDEDDCTSLAAMRADATAAAAADESASGGDSIEVESEDDARRGDDADGADMAFKDNDDAGRVGSVEPIVVAAEVVEAAAAVRVGSMLTERDSACRGDIEDATDTGEDGEDGNDM